MLVLASDTAPEYIKFQSIWKNYMNSNPNIDCYFYKGDPTIIGETQLDGDTLLIKIEDVLSNVYEKTLRAFKYFLPELHKYSFVFRTNLSSYINFDRYLQFCDTLPKTSCCAAVAGSHNEIPFPSGAGFTLSTDLVRRIIYETPAFIIQDDVTIGNALTNWNIQIIRANRREIIQGNWYHAMPPLTDEIIFHYRVKTDNRSRDAETLSELVAKHV